MLRKDLRKKAEQFRKAATPEEKLRLTDAVRREHNWVLGKSRHQSDLSFLDAWFDKEVAKPQAELAAVGDAWRAAAPGRTDAVPLSFKRGTLEVAVPTSAAKYKLEMELRTGLEQRLRAAHRGETLRKVKVVLAAPDSAVDTMETSAAELKRQAQVAAVKKAAEEGRL